MKVGKLRVEILGGEKRRIQVNGGESVKGAYGGMKT